MKIAPEVMAEFIDIFLEGITEMKDVSDRIRDIDLEPGPLGALVFTQQWLLSHPRGGQGKVS